MDRHAERLIDPGILEILGAVAEVLGLAEQAQRVLPTDRRAAQKRHRRVDNLVTKLVGAMDDARAALRTMSGAIEAGASDLIRDRWSFSIAPSEFVILTRGVYGLHEAIRAMTNTTFELETIASGLPDEAQRFYRISQAGTPVLNGLRSLLDGDAAILTRVLDDAERYLNQTARMLDERRDWVGP